MVQATLKETLELIGKLDDSTGDNSPRARFHNYLKTYITEVGQLRDYIEESIRKKDNQYSKAFQDLVNHLGSFLGFEVIYGRYSGVKNEIGFDGHWISPEGFHIVVEVKSSETYPIKTATLLEYMNQLISENQIPSDKDVIGIYVIGKPNPEVQQLKNAIIAENRFQQLRIISIDSLISLAELMNEYDVNHEDILSVLKPSGPSIDPNVEIMIKLASQQGLPPETPETPKKPTNSEGEVNYWITPVRDEEEENASETIQKLVGKLQFYAFGERTPGRKLIKQGDKICFYETGNGIVAHATVNSSPKKETRQEIRNPESYPWIFSLKDPKLYLDNPIIIDKSLRSQLDAFKGKDLNKLWAWFVQSTKKITEHDYKLLTDDNIN
ncbi:EVE domain-containing protein [Methanobacterium subterraneum]|uniref:EVE domain-containing protein n=1 Tax=Methanobacterium subterraneum TaxID=59277 RepID=UPI000C2D54C4|nr:EVE domain-containing protein [Methanobacterium subterraneum]